MKEVSECLIKIQYMIYLINNRYRRNGNKCNCNIIMSRYGKLSDCAKKLDDVILVLLRPM